LSFVDSCVYGPGMILWGVKTFAKRASPRLSLLLPLHLRSNATDTTTMEVPYKFDKSVPLKSAIYIIWVRQKSSVLRVLALRVYTSLNPFRHCIDTVVCDLITYLVLCVH
jgi:hypothetical protein